MNFPYTENSLIEGARFLGMLRLFGLWGDRHAPVSAYSKGMRQKVLISAALLHNPDLANAVDLASRWGDGKVLIEIYERTGDRRGVLTEAGWRDDEA